MAESENPSANLSKTKIVNINNLYLKVIRNHIFELLKVINCKYPTKFPRTEINIELDKIMANINLTTIIDNPKQINASNASNTTSSKPRKIKPKPNLEPAARCQARIWDNIYDRTTGQEITEMDDEFQVSDYNDINIKKFHKKYILGKQCARKKVPTPAGNYCLQHNKHRPHGNYLEQPSKELCYHFMIDGGYIDNSSNDE